MEWDELDIELCDALEARCRRGGIDERLARFQETCFLLCAEKFGVEEPKGEKEVRSVRPSKEEHRAKKFREEKKALRKQWRRASSAEKESLRPLWEDVKKRHADFRKAQRQRQRRRAAERARTQFYRNPHKFVRSVLEDGKSGELQVSRLELEGHLRRMYSDPRRNDEVEAIEGLVRPTRPGVAFNDGELRFSEVQAVVRKARAASSPGQNGLSYKLFKYCPGVLKKLWRLMRIAWREGVVPKSWCIAEGVYIPKEQAAKEIGQFRPISLLNVDGKIFFAVIARRLTSFVQANGFIDTSIQKAGIPGFPGCLEHAQMIWDAIKEARREKRSIDVVWLDLANAYGAIPHAFIRFAMNFFWVPQKVTRIVDLYYQRFLMRFSTRKYTTKWQCLEVGIPMGCTISPLLFVLAMEVSLKAAQSVLSGVIGPDGVEAPPLRAFMDDITVICPDEEKTRRGLERLGELMRWMRMEFKARKCRSLSIRRGKVEHVRFTVAGEVMPTVKEQPVKSLGRWYRVPLTDRHCGLEIQRSVEDGLKKIEKTRLPGRLKVWCSQVGLIPKVLWPLLVYEVALTRVESIERKFSVCWRRWLKVPRMITDIAFHCRSGSLQLPTRSIVEEFKCSKVRLALMMKDSPDAVVSVTQPQVATGRKWKAEVEVSEATSDAEWREVLGAVQQDRKGLGFGVKGRKWWSSADVKSRRELVVTEVRRREEQKRVAKAVQQSVQGAWTSWESVVERRLSWSDVWEMSPSSLKFLLSSTYDVLPTPANLKRWGISGSSQCPECERSQCSLEHILSACPAALERYTWRHNKVLDVLAKVVQETVSSAYVSQRTSRNILFVKEGEAPPEKTRRRQMKSLWRESASDWRVNVDRGGRGTVPAEVIRTELRPDIVAWSAANKIVAFVELTVPWETRMELAKERKLARYIELKMECERRGWTSWCYTVEVGCRGFIGQSVMRLLRDVGLSRTDQNKAVRELQEAAEIGSAWVMTKAKEVWRRKEDGGRMG